MRNIGEKIFFPRLTTSAHRLPLPALPIPRCHAMMDQLVEMYCIQVASHPFCKLGFVVFRSDCGAFVRSLRRNG
jgi:hypothetical protein